MISHGQWNVSILDGGLLKWEEFGGEVEGSEDDAKEEDYDYKLNTDQVVKYEDILKMAGDDNF